MTDCGRPVAKLRCESLGKEGNIVITSYFQVPWGFVDNSELLFGGLCM